MPLANTLPGISKEVRVYSGRHYNTDKDLYERFTEATGIQVKLLEAKDDALIERLNTEGDDSPADVLILADVARLDRAAGMNLFQTVDSDALNQAVPRDLRDSEGRWFGLTRRLRAPMFNADRVNDFLPRYLLLQKVPGLLTFCYTPKNIQVAINLQVRLPKHQNMLHANP